MVEYNGLDEEPPKRPNSSGGDLSAILAHMNLHFAQINDKISALAGKIEAMDAKVTEIGNAVQG